MRCGRTRRPFRPSPRSGNASPFIPNALMRLGNSARPVRNGWSSHQVEVPVSARDRKGEGRMANVVEKHSISSELAQRMVNAAVARAGELGVTENVAILDDGGNLKAFSRMDGASEIRVDEIGGHGRSVSPGGISLVVDGPAGARDHSHARCDNITVPRLFDQAWARPPSTNSSIPVTKLESS